MDSASFAGKFKKSKSDPNWVGNPLATAPAIPSLSSASLDWYDSQKRRDWNTFLQYLEKQEPPITLARCNEYHVLDFLRYLDQFGKTKVHITGCPFFGRPNPPAPCACPQRQSWVNLDALIERLRPAYEENGGRPESNPFAARFVRGYLSLVRECQVDARGIPFKRKEGKCPTTVTDKTVVASKGQGGNTTGTGSDGDGSGGAAQTTFTTASSDGV